jgi:organic radical activating enzyme
MSQTYNFPYILETHLADHCNLNCKGCSHFSPLVNGEVFTDIEIFKRDMARLRQLFDNIYEIRLMGGEPLLHPELLSFFDVTRQTFPRARIALFTNGIRLLNMDDMFWDSCAQNQILVKLSYYPIDLKIHEIKRKAKEKHVRIKTPRQIKSFFKHLNISGDSDPNTSFRNCRMMFKTPQLRDGKLYPCFFPAYVHFFSDYFNESIYATENDSINLFEEVHPADILKFMDCQIPMCRWCLTKRRYEEWGLSAKDIHEWIGPEADVIPDFFRSIQIRLLHLVHESKRKIHI